MRALLACAVALWLGGCAADPGWERRVVSIEATLARAEEAGAMRCAPRELALGRAHLGFATFERERGQRARAEEHLAIAEPNAGAALYLSPEARCSDQALLVAVDPEPLTDPAPAGHDAGHGVVAPPRDPEPAEPLDTASAPEPSADPVVAPAPDHDADGVPDSADECPRAAGEAGAACPGGYEGLVVRSERILLLRPLLLDADGAPEEATRPLLRALVRALRDRPAMRIEIGAHTDSEGTELENLAESQRRAERLRDLLVAEGADPERIRARGYGEELPLESNSTEEGRATNRRVEIRRTEAGDGAL
jgi:OOP family OmpA-OmpF porin